MSPVFWSVIVFVSEYAPESGSYSKLIETLPPLVRASTCVLTALRAWATPAPARRTL